MTAGDWFVVAVILGAGLALLGRWWPLVASFIANHPTAALRLVTLPPALGLLALAILIPGAPELSVVCGGIAAALVCLSSCGISDYYTSARPDAGGHDYDAERHHGRLASLQDRRTTRQP